MCQNILKTALHSAECSAVARKKDCLSTVLFQIAETVMYKTADTIDVGVCG
jgi:hypothetical protein